MATPPSALTIPDSLLAREATDILREHSTALLFNHSTRAYLFAAEQSRQHKLRFDPELLYVAAAFHDFGLIKKFSIHWTKGAHGIRLGDLVTGGRLQQCPDGPLPTLNLIRIGPWGNRYVERSDRVHTQRGTESPRRLEAATRQYALAGA
jgi:hypothetical protein